MSVRQSAEDRSEASRPLATAIEEYRRALEAAIDPRKEATAASVLWILSARQSIAARLAEEAASVEDTLALTAIDSELHAHGPAVVAVVGAKTFAGWRDSLARRETEWWWFLDRTTGESSIFSAALDFAMWITIAVSLSFIIEISRRLVSDAGVTGTVLQGLLGLAVGGTVIQLARQTVAWIGTAPIVERRRRRHLTLVFAAGLLSIAIALVLAERWIAASINDHAALALWRSADAHGAADPTRISAAIAEYERALRLVPDNAVVHYNLARTLERTFEYGRAEAEYRTALRNNASLIHAHARLGRLLLIAHSDFDGALRVTDAGLASLDGSSVKLAPSQVQALRYSLLVLRAWGYLGLKFYWKAREAVDEAIKLDPQAAPAHCVGAQVQQGLKQHDLEMKEWNGCLARASEDRADIEPRWLGLLYERVNQ